MKNKLWITPVLTVFLLGGTLVATPAQAKIKVVTTLTDYAYLAQEIGGDRVEVKHIAEGNQDAHFVKPKPSYAVMLKEADLLVSTGLDLELWLPALIDKSGNNRIRSGQKGYVQAAAGITMLEKPAGRPDRSEGDIHIYGNPHIHTSPVNARIIAQNIAIGLKKVDPAGADYYAQRERAFKDRLDKALFGETLVKLLGGDVLIRLLQQKKLFPFLKEKGLSDKLGGWLKEAEPLRGAKIVAYHKDWAYFAETFGLQIPIYIEPKPGIPPTPGHVSQVIKIVREQNIRAIVAPNYYERERPETVARKTGAKAVIVPLYVYGEPGVNSSFDLYSLWIKRLKAAL